MSNARENVIRVNDADLSTLKAAKAEFDANVPLGYVARKGAQMLIQETEDSEDPTFV